MVKPLSTALVRILSNELPPRDSPGSKLANLKHILETEPALEGVTKIWCLSHIVDEDLRLKYESLLCQYEQSYVYSILFNWLEYAEAKTHEEKVLAAIPLNKVRNHNFNLLKNDFDWLLILDGDCYLTAESWQIILQSLEDPQLSAYLYRSLLMSRVDRETQKPVSKSNEPQLAIHCTATELYDPNIMFSKGDKTELLFRLGHVKDKVDGKIVWKNTHDDAKTIVLPEDVVFHAETLGDECATDVNVRRDKRTEALQRFIAQIQSEADRRKSLFNAKEHSHDQIPDSSGD